MTLEPTPGLVLRYDYLWKEEAALGQDHGRKDRPCAIILATTPQEDGSREVILCAITHSPPADGQPAVAVPPKVAAHLGLDPDPCWIKTHEVNTLTWETSRLPFGVSEASKERWSFGMLPRQLTQAAFEQVRARARDRSLATVRRDKADDLGR